MINIKQLDGTISVIKIDSIEDVFITKNSIVIAYKDGTRQQYITGVSTGQLYTSIKVKLINRR